jgi:hypothetical protein
MRALQFAYIITLHVEPFVSYKEWNVVRLRIEERSDRLASSVAGKNRMCSAASNSDDSSSRRLHLEKGDR